MLSQELEVAASDDVKTEIQRLVKEVGEAFNEWNGRFKESKSRISQCEGALKKEGEFTVLHTWKMYSYTCNALNNSLDILLVRNLAQLHSEC